MAIQFLNTVQVDTDVLYVDAVNDRVGIGEQSPSAKLQITTPFASSPSDSIFLFTNGSNTLGGGSEIIFGSSTSATPTIYNAKIAGVRSSLDNGSSDLWFQTTHVATATAPTTKIIIKSDGNVGIGTTSPAAGLQVARGGTTIPLAGSSTASAVFGNSTSDDNYGVAIGANSSGVGYISSQRTDGTATTYNLAIQPNGGNVGIGTTSPGYKLEVTGNARVSTNFYIGNVDAVTTATEVLVRQSDRVRGITPANLIDSISAPVTPGSITSTIVGETIEISFNESTTSNIDYYQVWSSDDGGDFGIIAQITPTDFSSTMTVVDTTFVTGGTMSYRVYAVKTGIYSSPGTTSTSYTVGVLNVTNMSVVNLNTAYYIQYEKPLSRFIDHIEIYMDSQTTQGALNRSNASIVYSGQNPSYMRNIGVSNNFHQFWVEVVTT